MGDSMMSGYVTDESEMQQTDMDCSMTSSMTSDNIMRSVHERYSPVSSTHIPVRTTLLILTLRVTWPCQY